MKYKATLPPDSGQVAGTHTFSTARERAAFLKRIADRGIDTSRAKLTPEPKRKPK